MDAENELAFHLRDSLPSALSSDPFKNQGFMVGALTANVESVTGEPTEGKRTDHLLNVLCSQWYSGHDTLGSQEQVLGVNRHFAF